MAKALTPESLIGRDAVDPAGKKIGSIGQVYLDDQTGEPDWITVNTGLFGMTENFVPLTGSCFDGDHLVLPFDKDVVKDAPHIDDASHLDVDDEQSLYSYYQQHLSNSGTAAASDRSQVATGTNTTESTTRAAMSEEHLQVGTEQVEAGRVLDEGVNKDGVNNDRVNDDGVNDDGVNNDGVGTAGQSGASPAA